MDRIQIDRRQAGLRMRRREARAAAAADAAEPLRYTACAGAGDDDDLLARIDAVVEQERTARRQAEAR